MKREETSGQGERGEMQEWKSEGGNGKEGRMEGRRAGPIHRTEHGSPVHQKGRKGENEEIDFLPFLQLEASYESICKFLWSSLRFDITEEKW